MSDQFQGTIFRQNARGRREISTTGWIIILLAVFCITAATVFSARWFGTRSIVPLATASPLTVAPAGVSWTLEKQVLPGGTEVYNAPPDVRRQAVAAFIDAWNGLAFLNGFPDKVEEQQILNQYFWPGSPAFKGAAEIIQMARSTGTYWRREIIDQISLSSVVDFAQTGMEARFSIGFPAGNVRNELIDIQSGRVITSKEIDLMFFVTVRYDVNLKQWKTYQVNIPANRD